MIEGQASSTDSQSTEASVPSSVLEAASTVPVEASPTAPTPVADAIPEVSTVQAELRSLISTLEARIHTLENDGGLFNLKLDLKRIFSHMGHPNAL
jgi:hypothetical protein